MSSSGRQKDHCRADREGSRIKELTTQNIEQERAILVQVVYGRMDPDQALDSLEELERLADTAGAVVVGTVTQRRQSPTAAFFIGEGKLDDIQLACREAEADIVIFDNELTPVQVNNLDLAIGVKVIDRTELILQIFARRASSKEAQIQVELAQLQYLVSRVPVSMKQHRFTGGIGMKGPGESPFQLRQAPMRKRIADLKKKLNAIQKRRSMTRKRRKWPVVCLVGYTNAGKSTILNRFAAAESYVDDRLFATLDTKSRLVHVGENCDVMLIDTVGFIRHLPHGLVASFRSTLDVVAEADLLLVVSDAGHPCMTDHLAVVSDTLSEIKAADVPSLLLLNKCDSSEAEKALPALQELYPDALVVSAVRGDGLDALCRSISEKLAGKEALV